MSIEVGGVLGGAVFVAFGAQSVPLRVGNAWWAAKSAKHTVA